MHEHWAKPFLNISPININRYEFTVVIMASLNVLVFIAILESRLNDIESINHTLPALTGIVFTVCLELMDTLR